MIEARRKYLNGPFGQIHIHIWGQIDTANEILICLPPSPYSGRAYDTLAPILAEKSCAIAVDYPRFVEERQPSIRDYASIVHTVTRSLGTDVPVSLIGFHTGCLVAVEASLAKDIEFARLILIDVPYFSPERQDTLRTQKIGCFPITTDLLDLKSAWEMSVTRQKDKVSKERSFQMFVDHISAGISAGQPFAAAFNYDCLKQLPEVSTPCFVIATKAGLYEESLSAAKSISHSVLIEDLSIVSSVLERSAEMTANLIWRCLAN